MYRAVMHLCPVSERCLSASEGVKITLFKEAKLRFMAEVRAH
jgi:hypothetical protein